MTKKRGCLRSSQKNQSGLLAGTVGDDDMSGVFVRQLGKEAFEKHGKGLETYQRLIHRWSDLDRADMNLQRQFSRSDVRLID
jgi:hypothetical protein